MPAKAFVPKPFDPVTVLWEDAVTGATEQYNSVQEAIDAYKPCMRKTFGLFIAETEDVVIVATEDDRTDEYPSAFGGVTRIPAGMVHAITRARIRKT